MKKLILIVVAVLAAVQRGTCKNLCLAKYL
ncbi:hypothetical protein SAMN05192581_101366 [Bacteroides ovatus]|uniref:Uncharacterized protein n=1 Tax=Bacteroides ovatus TaxID=28116 RepID=A0A1G6G6M8_BACOV|nr:hypothetical protein SAMN05192581_101366 [Bacteroides ovatus]